MRTLCFTLATIVAIIVTSCAKNQKNPMEQIKKGEMEVVELDGFKLHIYRTLDALSDVSFIIEGKDGLVTLEHPLFKENISEFNAYINDLGKPVKKIIANYHTGGFCDFHDHDVVMVEGMPEFEKGPFYSGMIGSFAQVFGDAIDLREHAEPEIVKLGTTETWAGIEFKFTSGASSDIPAASIIIGGQVYYCHWTPAKAHMSHLQVVSQAAINAEITETENVLNSGCKVIIGSHGGKATREDVEFKLAYLKKAKELRTTCISAEEWVEAMKATYPSLPGAEGLKELSETIYK